LFTYHDSKCYTHDLLNCQCENGSDKYLYPDNNNFDNDNNNFDNDDDDDEDDSLDGFIVHDSDEEREKEGEKEDKEEKEAPLDEIIIDDDDDDNDDNTNSNNDDDDDDDEGDIYDLSFLDDNDENNTDFLEVGSFQTEAHLGSSIFGTKDSNNHHMDELKNEWLHYIVDPIQLKPFTKKIQEIEANLSEKENTKDPRKEVEEEKVEKEVEKEGNDIKENNQISSSQDPPPPPSSSQIIARTLLKDTSFDLPYQSLNDNILKTMIVEEGIECLKYMERNKKKGEEDEKENAIEYIFTREFRN
ncbi:hypothetical protein PIROE2DRAFT_10110, partial [Piromyces sp. E2]